MIKIRFTDTDAGNENEFEGRLGYAVMICDDEEGKTYDAIMISGGSTGAELAKSLGDLVKGMAQNGIPKELILAAVAAGLLTESKETEPEETET